MQRMVEVYTYQCERGQVSGGRDAGSAASGDRWQCVVLQRKLRPLRDDGLYEKITWRRRVSSRSSARPAGASCSVNSRIVAFAGLVRISDAWTGSVQWTRWRQGDVRQLCRTSGHPRSIKA